jgi:hypothetical protein
VWSVGDRRAGKATITLRRGGSLTIVNRDVDFHRLVQMAGPRVRLSGRPLGMHGRERVVFSRPGVYRLGTSASAMPMMPDIETIGRPWRLTLLVRVR